MKVIHVNHSDVVGGAARAVFRIHNALREIDVDSVMRVSQVSGDDWSIVGSNTKLQKTFDLIRRVTGDIVSGTLKINNSIMHSPAVISSGITRFVNLSDCDLVHLHWVNNEMISIKEIGRISKPVIWTLHDMWAFCGAEHYTDSLRWRDGYFPENRPLSESGFDLNRWVWKRKVKYWKKHFHIVCPSMWLANCVQQSALMGDWPLSVVPNPIDTDKWLPMDKKNARELLSLPDDKSLLLFGAYGGASDPRKGFDLLRDALLYLTGMIDNLEIVVFGQRRPENDINIGFPVHFVGHLFDDLSLRVLYSAVDVLANPARQEAFGQTASEAHACATPVVAFDNTGLADIVVHKKTGYLAKAFDTEDFANGIQWVIENESGHLCSYFGCDDSNKMSLKLGENARIRAVNKFSYPVVAKEYNGIYDQYL